jgi:3-(3-hydroxy-phenyl)propionate hydroxylase
MSLIKNTLAEVNSRTNGHSHTNGYSHTNGHGPSISHTTLRQPLKHRVPVCIVGGGIVGLTCALILHQQGIKVHVYERQLTLYPLPRAVVMAEDTQHLLATAGMSVELDRHVGEIGQPDKFIWKGCDGKTMTYLDMAAEGLCGYRSTTCFSQPTLESALALRCESYGIPVYRDWQLESVDEKTNSANQTKEYTAHFARYKKTERPYQTSLEVEAEYLVSAEGCNSMIREMFGFKEIDYGFTYDWLVIDVVSGADKTSLTI